MKPGLAQQARSAAARADDRAPITTVTPHLNFLLIGECRSAASAVVDLLNNHGAAVCHAGLFAPTALQRRQAHEGYFGPSPTRRPAWFCAGERELEGGRHSNPWEYLDGVLATTREGERAVGLHLDYDTVARHQLYEFIAALTARGDFCVVHLVRNPVACLVSRQQAQDSNYWVSYRGESLRYTPLAVSLPADQVFDFAERSCVVRDKVAAAASDAVEVHYQDLVGHFDRVAGRLFQFLELPPARPVCRTRRLVPLPLRRRLLNFEGLARKAPSSQRHWFDDKEVA